MFLFPLVATLLSSVISMSARSIGHRGSAVTSIACLFVAYVASVLVWYEVALGSGLSIPRDLSVVAHDDVLPQVQTETLDPPLSVTRLPLRDASDPLADLLVRRISGDPVESLQVTREPEVIERGSVARAHEGNVRL